MKSFLTFLGYVVGLVIMVLGAALVFADPLTSMWSDLFMRLAGLVLGFMGASIMSESVDSAF